MRRWTDEQLRQAVAENTCLSKTIRALGLRRVGANYDTIRRASNRLGLSTAHWGPVRYRSTTRSALVRAVETSDSIASCITRLGWPVKLLCPNCHALTPTYRGRNVGRYNVADT